MSDLWQVGIWPDVQDSPEWEVVEGYLKPAAKQGDVSIERGPGWTVWTVHKNGLCVGAANVRRTTDAIAEVALVGGTGAREWIEALDDMIGCWAHEEGCTALRAFGRRGWLRVLTNWRSVKLDDGGMAYERSLPN